MTVAIIGASLAGLAAAREIIRKGHDVMVFEKESGFGGRLFTSKINDYICDMGTSYFTADNPEFKGFCDELVQKGVLKTCTKTISGFDGQSLTDRVSGKKDQDFYIAPKGANEVGNFLMRWVDINFGESVSGITYIGENPTKKKPWMINLTSFNVFEADAVIVALPAPQAYGIIMTTQDEREVKTIITEVDEVEYQPEIVASLLFKNRKESFQAIELLEGEIIQIGNESTKRDTGEDLVLTVRSNQALYEKVFNLEDDIIARVIGEKLTAILGSWTKNYDNYQIRRFKYAKSKSVLNGTHRSWKGKRGYLALTGDYFQHIGLDAAYKSGLAVADELLAQI